MIDPQEAQVIIRQVDDLLKTVFGVQCSYVMMLHKEGSDGVDVLCTMQPDIAAECMHHLADRINAGAGQIYINQKPS